MKTPVRLASYHNKFWNRYRRSTTEPNLLWDITAFKRIR